MTNLTRWLSRVEERVKETWAHIGGPDQVDKFWSFNQLRETSKDLTLALEIIKLQREALEAISRARWGNISFAQRVGEATTEASMAKECLARIETLVG